MPKAAGKTLFASVREPIAQVIADAFAEADRRDPDHARAWIAVVDGNGNNVQIAATTALAAERQAEVPVLIGLHPRRAGELKALFDKLKQWSDEFLEAEGAILERAAKAQRFSDYLLKKASDERAAA